MGQLPTQSRKKAVCTTFCFCGQKRKQLKAGNQENQTQLCNYLVSGIWYLTSGYSDLSRYLDIWIFGYLEFRYLDIWILVTVPPPDFCELHSRRVMSSLATSSQSPTTSPQKRLKRPSETGSVYLLAINVVSLLFLYSNWAVMYAQGPFLGGITIPIPFSPLSWFCDGIAAHEQGCHQICMANRSANCKRHRTQLSEAWVTQHHKTRRWFKDSDQILAIDAKEKDEEPRVP